MKYITEPIVLLSPIFLLNSGTSRSGQREIPILINKIMIWVNASMNEQMDEWMDGWMDGQMDEWMDGWMDGWMNG